MAPALLGLLAIGCAGRRAPAPEEGATILGWRLVPGMELSYAFDSTYLNGGEGVERLERWSYLVRAVDERGAARLEGRLTGFGAGVSLGGVYLDAAQVESGRRREVERLAEEPAELSLSMDGRVQIGWGSWADRLPHQLLGLPLPERPVLPGDTWASPAVLRPYADLLPVGLELELSATSRLEAIAVRDGITQARISTSGELRPADAELTGGVALRGEAWWDLRAGRLTERSAELWPITEPAEIGEAERLRLTLRLAP